MNNLILQDEAIDDSQLCIVIWPTVRDPRSVGAFTYNWQHFKT